MEERKTVTTKIWKGTLQKLKLIAVLRQQTMLETLDALISQDLERLQSSQQREQQ
jgi:hypothetical protein